MMSTGLTVDERTLRFIDLHGHDCHVLAGARRALEPLPPVVLEIWPYGLARTRGAELIQAGRGGYRRFYDINQSPPTGTPTMTLSLMARSIGDPNHQTDILALS